MPLRLIEMVVAEKEGGEVLELLKEHKLLEHRQMRLADEQLLVRILLDAQQSEAVLDALEEWSTDASGHRVVILPVEATVPRAEPEPADAAEPAAAEDTGAERIGREELYEDIKNAAQCSRVYLAMVLSVIIGVAVQVSPATPEVASRDGVGLGELAVALASGCAGALAFTTGVSTTLIGVMVAVALLPPLVTSGLLLGGGHPSPAMGALSLFFTNLIRVNLAGVTTFLIQGISPGHLVGEGSRHEGHANCPRAVGAAAGGTGRHGVSVAKGLSVFAQGGDDAHSGR